MHKRKRMQVCKSCISTTFKITASILFWITLTRVSNFSVYLSPLYPLTLLDEGKCAGESTLVHCRAGVSRSASICIAEVMRREEKTLPRAYLYVRARRLNVIIQP